MDCRWHSSLNHITNASTATRKLARVAGVRLSMVNAKVRTRAYLVLAAVPAIYWTLWCAFGVLFFGGALFGNWAGVPFLVVCIIGLAGLAYSFRALWSRDKATPKSLLIKAFIYLILASILGLVVWVQFVPTRHGLLFGWWLISVAIVAAGDFLIQYLTIRLSRPPSASA